MNRRSIHNIEPRAWWFLLVIMASSLSILNILYFISQASNPIIRSDGWYFLDSVISSWAREGFELADLFAKRGIFDHAQPLNKLALWANYKFFKLDFRLEALLGFCGLFALIITLLILYITQIDVRNKVDTRTAIAFVCAILVISSLNSTGLYSWPLVTFGFLILFIISLISWQTYRYLTSQKAYTALALSALLFFLIGDTAAVIVWASLLSTIVIFFVGSDTHFKKNSFHWLFWSASFVIAYFVWTNISFIDLNPKPAVQLQSSVNWLDPYFYFESIRIIFSASIMYNQHLAHFDDTHERIISWVVAFAVFLAYVWYFFNLIFMRKNRNCIKFYTTFILVYATISVLGIIAGRVDANGVNYLYQPRYVFIYQLIPFALLIDLSFTKKRSAKRSVTTLFSWLGFALLVVLQSYYTARAYYAIPWISRNQEEQAKTIGRYMLNPSAVTETCPPGSLPLCSMSNGKRAELLNLMASEDLNVMNFDFQWRYRIFPLDENLGALSQVSVSNWGPRVITVTSEHTPVWIKLDEPLIDSRTHLMVRIGTHEVAPQIARDLITFVIPNDLSNSAGDYPIELLDFSSKPLHIGTIKVTTPINVKAIDK